MKHTAFYDWPKAVTPPLRHPARPASRSGPPAGMRFGGIPLLPLLLFLNACDGASTNNAPGTAPAPPPPHVILISMDTVRADHLSCYGFNRPTTPNIDQFAAGATLYTRMFSSAPWTVPAHASLFTGRFSFEHGARIFPVERPMNNVNPLPARNLTLAEALHAEGYATGAFAANFAYLDRKWGLDQGFEYYYVENIPAAELNQHALEWISTVADRPVFLFINYIDAHWPYNTTPMPGFLTQPRAPSDFARFDHVRNAVLAGEVPPPESLRIIHEQYVNAIAYIDHHLGALFDRLRSIGFLDNSVIVITSDHGEYFGEHQLISHSKDVYQEVLWTPLIVRRPGAAAPERIDTLVSSTDVPGLILQSLGPALSGKLAPLFPDLPGNHLVIAESYYTLPKDLFHPRWGHRFNRVRTAVYQWPHKFIHSSDDNHELYNLAEDPREQRNLISEQPLPAERLRIRLDELKSQRGRFADQLEDVKLDAETLNKLRTLGYIDS